MQIVLILLAFDWPLMMFFFCFFLMRYGLLGWFPRSVPMGARTGLSLRGVSRSSSSPVDLQRLSERISASLQCARADRFGLCREPRAVKRRSYFRTRGYKALYGVFYTRVFYLYINHRCGLRTVFSTVHLNLEMLHNSPV